MIAPSSFLSRCGALVALGLAFAACTASDSTNSTVAPTGGEVGGGGGLTATGLALLRGQPLSGVTVRTFSGTTELTALETTTNSAGRWRVAGLDAGSYRFDLVPPTPDPNDPDTDLRTTSIGPFEVDEAVESIPPAVFAPVVGGVFLTDGASSTVNLTFLNDPSDSGSGIPPGLEQFAIRFRSGTRLRLDGVTLITLGEDDDSSTNGFQRLFEIAIIEPQDIPVPFRDEEGTPLATRAFYALYPMRWTFEAPAAGTPREFELDYSNLNGYQANGLPGVWRLDPDDRVWTPAGTALVAGSGDQIRQDNNTGILQSGFLAHSAEPPPTLDVMGQILNSGMPLARAGIRVVSNAGFQAVTDETGAYFIDDVPVPYNAEPLTVTAYSDAGSSFATATVESPRVFPTTTIDIELGDPTLTAPSCDLANSEPLEGATGVRTNDPIRLRFTGDVDAASLTANVVASASSAAGTVAVTGTFVTETSPAMGGGVQTDAWFLTDENLPTDASVSITVGSGTMDVGGNLISAACTLSFETGTSTLLLPDVFVAESLSGTVESQVRLFGSNLDLAALQFDGEVVAIDSATPRELVFTVPLTEGTEAPGPRTIQVDPGGLMLTYDLLPRIDAVQIDVDEDPGIELLEDRASGLLGTAVAGVDQNDGDLVVLIGQNLTDTLGGAVVVTFGNGDADTMTTGDGDAAIDAGDESSSVNRIDVRIPPFASVGGLTVSADVGGTIYTSPPFVFSPEVPEDDVAATVVAASETPADGATGVATSAPIQVTLDEPVSAEAEMLVGFGMPLRLLPGETVVSTSADGTQGILEFVPEDGALPASEAILVQIAGARVVDYANNPVNDFSWTFTTGTTEPTGPPPTGGTDAEPPLALPGLGVARDSNAVRPDGGAATSAAALAEAWLAGTATGASAGARAKASYGPSPAVAGGAGSAADLGVRVDASQVQREGELLTRLRLQGIRLDAAHEHLAIEIAPADGTSAAAPVRLWVGDLDGDGRLELHARGGPGFPALLHATERVTIGSVTDGEPDWIELLFPSATRGSGEPLPRLVDVRLWDLDEPLPAPRLLATASAVLHLP